MPTYKITAPDGRAYHVTAPEGSSQDEVMSYFRSNYAKEAARVAYHKSQDERIASGRIEGNPLDEMSTGEKYAANIGAGAHQMWRGAKQLVGAWSDDQESGQRELDSRLADSVTGGGFSQAVGATLPFVAIPGGSLARAATGIPGIGAKLAAAGVGARALPTLATEGAILGGASGVLSPTTEDESRGLNAAMGAAGGVAIPAAFGAGSAIYRNLPLPGANALRRGRVAKELAKDLGQQSGVIASTIRKNLGKGGLTETPSTAVMTQNPTLANAELQYRAHPEFSAQWQRFDDTANTARWKALDETLGSAESVENAKEITKAFSDEALPKFYKAVDRKRLAANAIGFDKEVNSRLSKAFRSADDDAKKVYGYIKSAKDAGASWSPRALWNLRQTLNGWAKGTPPAGFERVRADKIDADIAEVRKAIDAMLDDSSSGQWGKFLGGLAEKLQKEGSQKAGQNIRNVFQDETLGIFRTPAPSGNPKVTRAALSKAYSKFGKNRFGESLDWPQEDSIMQVMNDLQAQEILNTAKTSMTGGGGSQTAPMLAKLASRGTGIGGSDVMAILEKVRGFGAGKQRQIVNEMLMNPAYAMELLQLANKKASPLTNQERALILIATRGGAVLPVAAVGAN